MHKLLFFDEKRFAQDLQTKDTVSVFRNALNASRKHFNNRFIEGEDTHTLVNESAKFIDIILSHAWGLFEWDDNISLIAVGGYGRGELHPHSDIDLLILTGHDKTQEYVQQIEKFLALLWDVQLKIGHSVRSIPQCIAEAKKDITIMTNLMETRLICGNKVLRESMLEKTNVNKIWSSAEFYQGKINEQSARYRKHDGTEYNLEPNIKEAPGGLRDIQLIGWTAKRHFNVNQRLQLVENGSLSYEEYLALKRDEAFLWKVRYGLHMLCQRDEERLLFDHQRKLASMFGYSDSGGKLAVEKFMQHYYQTVLSVRELNDVFLQYLDEEIYHRSKTKVVEAINERFIIHDNYLDTRVDTVFSDSPSALLEIFVILGKNSDIKGIRASAIRQIRLYRKLIDNEFRADPVNRRLFMQLLKSPYNLTLQLQRMNRYGILGSYLPEFGKIVGQMQHDLFHIYPVDVHTLAVIRNIRCLTNPDMAVAFPISSHLFKHLPKPELIIIAALYHDIGKGRGGDHSTLGAVDVVNFAKNHGLQSQETDLLKWLVENHLLMSTISQREDTSDPDVIYKFAHHVGDSMHLDYLYILTVADINATNPKLWNDWKGTLMNNLYFETKRVLQDGLAEPLKKIAWVKDAKDSALRLLQEQNIDRVAINKIWENLTDECFLRERAEDIAIFTRTIIDNPCCTRPTILLRDIVVEIPVATQIFVYTKTQPNLFRVIAAVLDKLQLDIQDARLQTTSNNRTFDVFYVLDKDNHPVGSNQLLRNKIIDSLKQGILDPCSVNIDIQRRTSRRLKEFTMKTVAKMRNDSKTDTTMLQVITPDRPGLLAQLADIFSRFSLNLHNARISTLGERVEDTFYITDQNNQLLIDQQANKEIQEAICNELDARNCKEAQI